MQNLKKSVGMCNIRRVNSYLTVERSDRHFTEEAIMSDKKKNEKPASQPDTKADKKTSETVHLSAEELRKISGGVTGTPTTETPTTTG